ncbi:MAG TPA: anthranilate phosphoribosyltransferase [Dehalococcoidia bacterium]|nr:anthranilate phosphoribosyltransferase [Dehalococcoidia bacterium]
MIREAISKVVSGSDLTEDEAASCMQELMSEEATASQAAALLVALRMKGETADEIAGMVRVMREKALRVEVSGDILDVVSTGGGSFDPFNISTTASLVCAGAGVRVAKHGNRGFTSASGAADVMEALGAKLDLTPEQTATCIEQTGFGFLFAQALHPAMRFVGPTRREIGIRTIFNSLGPLTNPAGAQFQLLGVGDAAMAEKVATVLGRLGAGHALVVHSEDGLDEVSLGAPTTVYELTGGATKTYTLTPEEAGFARIPLSAVKTGTKEENAARLRDVLAGRPGPDRDYTLVNAGAALVAANKASSVKEGAEIAKQAVDSGAAAKVLDAYVAATLSFGG